MRICMCVNECGVIDCVLYREGLANANRANEASQSESAGSVNVSEVTASESASVNVNASDHDQAHLCI